MTALTRGTPLLPDGGDGVKALADAASVAAARPRHRLVTWTPVKAG